MRQIKIQIYPDGLIQAKTNGIVGKSCTDYIKIIEDITNSRTVESFFTEDYFKNENLLNTDNFELEEEVSKIEIKIK